LINKILGKTFISDNLRLRKKFRSLGSSIRSPRYEQRSKEIGFVTSESETVRFHQFRVLEFREIHVRPQRLRLMARVAKVAPVSSSSSLYCYFRFNRHRITYIIYLYWERRISFRNAWIFQDISILYRIRNLTTRNKKYPCSIETCATILLQRTNVCNIIATLPE